MDGAKGIVVYGASSSDIDSRYLDFAYETGAEIARRGCRLVNGGGRGGVMAASIEGALDAGGEVIGVLPEFMVGRGWNHPRLTEMVTTASMHERKLAMAERSAGAVALPGGVGTLDELFEIITWRQLGLYDGNVVIANAFGFYDLLLDHLHRADCERFMRDRGLWRVAFTPAEAVAMATGGECRFDSGEKY